MYCTQYHGRPVLAAAADGNGVLPRGGISLSRGSSGRIPFIRSREEGGQGGEGALYTEAFCLTRIDCMLWAGVNQRYPINGCVSAPGRWRWRYVWLVLAWCESCPQEAVDLPFILCPQQERKVVILYQFAVCRACLCCLCFFSSQLHVYFACTNGSSFV